MPNVTEKLKHDPHGKSKYMKKCVHVMVKEGKTPEQAVGACLNMWRTNWKKKKSKGGIEFPVWEEHEIGEFIIE